MLIFQVRCEIFLELEACVAEIRFEGVKSTAAASQLIRAAKITIDIEKTSRKMRLGRNKG
ncbi:hypothetical protein C6500_03105 [Candidatus Poribacteria bacterium]|nr:MAG: hypothetical protein C6500_03105 [Candidatus Poribacteria bacterium]